MDRNEDRCTVPLSQARVPDDIVHPCSGCQYLYMNLAILVYFVVLCLRIGVAGAAHTPRECPVSYFHISLQRYLEAPYLSSGDTHEACNRSIALP